jgi:hypothetical protein
MKGGCIMKRILLSVIVMLVLVVSPVGAMASRSSLDDLKTPAEESNWLRTSSSQEVIDFCEKVADLSHGRIRVETVGYSTMGKRIIAFVAGRPAPKDPSDVSDNKVVVYVNCNIHSGEIEGKEAVLILAREIAQGKHDKLLKDVVLLVTPNISPDANDDLGPNRINTQPEPQLVGTRSTPMGLNLNRDMTKLEGPEAQVMAEIMNEWDPVIFIDAHATNGSRHRHELSYSWPLHPNTDVDLMEYNRDEFIPKALGPGSYLDRTYGYTAIPYGNFSGNPSSGWFSFEDLPRYTTNYAGLRNRLSLLLECYSYNGFEKRVQTQYGAILGAAQTCAADKKKIKALIAQADARSIGRAETGLDPVKDVVSLKSEMVKLNEITILTYVYNLVGTRWVADLTQPAVLTVDNYNKFVPVNTVPMGAYYFMHPGCLEAMTTLVRHGIEVYRLTEAITIPGQRYRITSSTVASNLYEGHYLKTITGSWMDEEITLPAGTYVVSTAQTSAPLVGVLLEPESVDGLGLWNVFDKRLGADRNYFPVMKTMSYSAISDNMLEPVGEGRKDHRKKHWRD